MTAGVHRARLPATERRRTTSAYYLAFVGFGLATAALGPSLDVLRDRVGVDRGTIAVLLVLNALGYAGGSLVLGRLYDHRPGHPLLRTWLLLAAAGMLGLALAPTLAAQSLAVTVVGFAGGGIDTGANALIARVHAPEPGRALTGLHSMFGLGALSAPLILAVSRRAGHGIGPGLTVVAVVLAAAGLFVARVPSPRPPGHETTAGPAPTRPVLVMFAAFFFCYVGLEIVMAAWIFPYATDRGMTPTGSASWLTAAFWAAFTIGRLAGIPLARMRSSRLLGADIAIAAAAAVGLGLAHGDPSGIWVCTLALGLGFATMFPAMLTQAHGTIGLSGATTGWFITGSGLGSALLPWATGQLFDARGSTVLPVVLLLNTLACGACAAGAVAVSQRRSHPLDAEPGGP